MSKPFAKLIKSKAFDELIKNAPNAFLLLSLIARRARYNDEFNTYNLKPGQAMIGDYEACGLTERKYRTAKGQLQKWGFATFKATNKGTIATLINSDVFDINIGGKRRTSRQTSDGQATTKKKEKKEKKRGDNGLHPLSPEFCLKEKHRHWAVKNGLGDIDIETEIEKFREYYTGNGGLRANWDFVFYGWLRKCCKFGGPPEPAKEKVRFFEPTRGNNGYAIE